MVKTDIFSPDSFFDFQLSDIGIQSIPVGKNRMHADFTDIREIVMDKCLRGIPKKFAVHKYIFFHSGTSGMISSDGSAISL